MGLNRRSGVWAFVGLLVLLLGTGGCNTGNEADSSPSVSEGTATRTSLPAERPTNVEPPPRPPAMDNADEAGAVAAAEYFLRLTVYAAASGDTTELEAMSGEGCEGCQSYVSSVKDLHEQGGWWASVPEVSIHSAASRPIEGELAQYQVELDAEKGGYNYINGKAEQLSVEPESVVMAFVVTYRAGWVIEIAQSFPEGTKLSEEG
ncbi:DUF6318 family protein [Actinomycetaceae bacterium L2_0104]